MRRMARLDTASSHYDDDAVGAASGAVRCAGPQYLAAGDARAYPIWLNGIAPPPMPPFEIVDGDQERDRGKHANCDDNVHS